MVLEAIANPTKAIKDPWKLFFIGIIYGSIGILLSLWVFKSYSSLVMVFLTVIACIPLMINTLKIEENKDATISNERLLMKEHIKALKFLVFLFLGFLLAYSFFFVILPASTVQTLFVSQIDTISQINSGVTGGITNPNMFSQIFFNNIRVLMFCVFFAFFFGAGAIFIITWNASVIATAIGTFAKNKIAELASIVGSLNLFHYFHMYSLGWLRYSIHGIPEITAYFVGGIAGGIISVAMINHDLESEKFKNIMIDALDLTMLAVFILFVAALMEVYLTPIFF